MIPAIPTIKSKLAARKMPIPTLDAAALGGVAPGAAGSHVVKGVRAGQAAGGREAQRGDLRGDRGQGHRHDGGRKVL